MNQYLALFLDIMIEVLRNQHEILKREATIMSELDNLKQAVADETTTVNALESAAIAEINRVEAIIAALRNNPQPMDIQAAADALTALNQRMVAVAATLTATEPAPAPAPPAV